MSRHRSAKLGASLLAHSSSGRKCASIAARCCDLQHEFSGRIGYERPPHCIRGKPGCCSSRLLPLRVL